MKHYGTGGPTAPASKARQLGWLLLCFTSSILVVLLAIKWLIANEVLLLKKIEVEGNRYLTQQEVLEMVNLNPAKSLYNLEFRKIAEQVKRHQMIQDATVHLRLPSAIVIRVNEKRPLAVHAGRELIPIDESGSPLPRRDAELLHDYPVISGLELENPVTKDSGYGKTVAFLAQTRESNFLLYSQISEVSFSERIGLYFFLNRGTVPVFVGSGHEVQKGKNLVEVLQFLSDSIEEIEYFDLRFKNQVVVKEHERLNNLQGGVKS